MRMRSATFVAIGSVMCAVLAAGSVRGETEGTDEETPSPSPEPTDTHPSTDATTPTNPFRPNEIGPPSSAWDYDQLDPAEQVVVDRGFETQNWATAQQAYAAAAQERYPAIVALRAQLMLAVPDLAEVGVVP